VAQLSRLDRGDEEPNAIEQDLWSLSSPVWPEKLVPIDKTLAEAGKPIFDQHCGSCHLPIDRISPSRRIVARCATSARMGR
jgi:hypothetical protein